MAVTDTLINTLFDGRYRIIRKLGSGGMANVYLAEDQELGRRVAIKILNDRHANDDQFVERFRREAKNAAALSHANIVSIYDRGEAEGTYYIAMEYLEGRSLKELIVARGPAPISISIDYARQILAALKFAHRNGIVHRDIKPHNVVVDAEGRVKVTDFGIARAGASQMTEVGSIIGTAQYLSPEQAKGAPVDQTSDLYSLGIVLYELLTGEVPFSGDTPVEIAMKHISAKPDPPSTLREELPRDLDLVVMRALAKNPSERYQSADEMDRDLDRVARGVAVTRETEDAATAIISRPAAAAVSAPPQPSVYYDYDEPVRRRPVWPWILTALLLIGALGAGWYVYTQVQDELGESTAVAVPYVVDSRESEAVAQILAAELTPEVIREPSADVEEGFVFRQEPAGGARVDKESAVQVYVSTGPPQTEVPDVIGETRDDAVAALARADLEAKVVQVYSGEEPGTVTGQSPRGGEQVQVGTRVQINVSQGRRPVTVPNVVGDPFETAESKLQGAGLSVTRQDVDSLQPAGTVVGQNPSANASVPPGTAVTVSVSRGPATTGVPNVEGAEEDDARSAIEEAGFDVRVVDQPTDQTDQDGIVLSQDPAPGTQAEQGTVVTIVVGRFTEELPSP
jgi:beta-lactam-binding protein with PASTA domain/predicted Ser/Thr protein kinase